MKEYIKKLGMLFGAGFLIGVFLSVGPLLAIWAVNTLFTGLSIPVTLSTWFAAFLLMIMFGNKGVKSASKY